MNFNNHQLALPAAFEEDSNEIYTFQSPRRQSFDFLNPIMQYIIENPTAETWKKLIMTCKYFYSTVPAYPISNFRSHGVAEWCGNIGEIFSLNYPLPKLWLFENLYEYGSNVSSNKISSLIPKLAKCHLSYVVFQNQNLTFEEYQFLTSSGTIKRFDVTGGTIKYSDGPDVTFDILLENLQNVRYFVYWQTNSSMFKHDTVKKMVRLLRQFKKLDYFKLTHLTETFDISSITDFLFENQVIEICFAFGYQALFDDEYKQKLDECFEKVINNPPKKLTTIFYPGINSEQFDEYNKIYQ